MRIHILRHLAILLNGENKVARTEPEAHYVLECSRGSKILKKYWKEFTGILVSDGYAPYRTVFSDNVKQRCTAQLQREAKHLARKSKHKQVRILYGEFPDVPYCARVWSVEEHLEKQHKRHARDLLNQTDCIVQQYMVGDDEKMIQFGKKLKTARNSLFTFVMYCNVPSTNNDAENSIRKCIIQRNVRGQMKNNQGMMDAICISYVL